VRADAQRNTDALLEAALAVFATSGVDAPVREIAEKAGVSVSALFIAIFRKRADLVAAVFRHEVDACADAAPVPGGRSMGQARAFRSDGCSAMQTSSRPKRRPCDRAATRETRPSTPYPPYFEKATRGPRFEPCWTQPPQRARYAPMSSRATC